jgi:hypothetical protein
MNALTTFRNAVNVWIDEIERTGGEGSSAALMAEIAVLNASHAVWPDYLADLAVDRTDELARQYGIDPEGYPVDDEPLPIHLCRASYADRLDKGQRAFGRGL